MKTRLYLLSLLALSTATITAASANSEVFCRGATAFLGEGHPVSVSEVNRQGLATAIVYEEVRQGSEVSLVFLTKYEVRRSVQDETTIFSDTATGGRKFNLSIYRLGLSFDIDQNNANYTAQTPKGDIDEDMACEETQL